MRPTLAGLCALPMMLWPAPARCQGTRPATDSLAVRAVVAGIVAADNARDLSAVLAFYADSALLLQPNEPAAVGHAAIRPRYQALFRDFNPAIEGRIDEIVVAGERAYARGHNGGWLRGRAGVADRPLDDVYLMVLGRRAGGWRITRLMWHRASAAVTTPAASAPACAASEYRQFDFWLGDWRVTRGDGRMAGHNRVQPILGGCVLHESWTGADGGKGESFNLYDRGDRRWHQTWVDGQGLLLQLEGGLQGGAMVLEGERPAPDGSRVRHRITWTPLEGGAVRQRWERSRDGGGRWETVFDGTYQRSMP